MMIPAKCQNIVKKSRLSSEFNYKGSSNLALLEELANYYCRPTSELERETRLSHLTN